MKAQQPKLGYYADGTKISFKSYYGRKAMKRQEKALDFYRRYGG